MYKFSPSRRVASRALFAAALALSVVAPSAWAQDSKTSDDPPAAAKVEKQTRGTPKEAPVKKEVTKAPVAATEEKPAAEAATEEKPAAEGSEGESGEAEAPAVPTEEEREAAKAAFEKATAAFGEEDYEGAVAAFKEAYAKVPSPHAEYWIARSMDSADPENKNAAEVVKAYSKFLTNPGAQHVGAERVQEAQSRVAELKKLLPAQITLVTVPEGATLTVDGEAKEAKTPTDLELAAGTHQIKVELEGYESTMIELDVQGGSTVQQEVTLAKLPPPPEPETQEEEPSVAPPPTERSMVPAAVTLGLGGAGLISGTLFGIMALGAKSDFNDNPTTDNADTAERNALIADMSFGIALTLGITGIVLLTADDDEAAAEKAASRKMVVAPYASQKGGGLAGLLRF